MCSVWCFLWKHGNTSTHTIHSTLPQNYEHYGHRPLPTAAHTSVLIFCFISISVHRSALNFDSLQLVFFVKTSVSPCWQLLSLLAKDVFFCEKQTLYDRHTPSSTMQSNKAQGEWQCCHICID